MDLTFRVVRDLFSPEVEEFLVDDRRGLRQVLGFANTLVPQLADRVKRYEGKQPIFEATGIEKEIEKALRRRVWLKSGGYIVIDHTEALIAIDVNTGKYVGKRDFEETVLKINLEAAAEAVRQIRPARPRRHHHHRLHRHGAAEHREQVSRALSSALADDKSRTNVLEISELGIVEMTRKRARQDLQSMFCAPCPTCKGSGHVRSDATLAAEIFRKIQAQAPDAPAGGEVLVRAHPELRPSLRGGRARGRRAAPGPGGPQDRGPGGADLHREAVRCDLRGEQRVTRPSRISRAKILDQLRLAGRKGDRTALTLATDQMKTLAYSPRYWEKYLELLANPLARLVDLLLIKQGDKIARQKGWVKPRRERSAARGKAKPARAARPRRRPAAGEQGSLFPDLS